VEAVDARAYRRTVRIERQGRTHSGWITVTTAPQRGAPRCVSV
jgi:hypothetical protein